MMNSAIHAVDNEQYKRLTTQAEENILRQTIMDIYDERISTPVRTVKFFGLECHYVKSIRTNLHEKATLVGIIKHALQGSNRLNKNRTFTVLIKLGCIDKEGKPLDTAPRAFKIAYSQATEPESGIYTDKVAL